MLQTPLTAEERGDIDYHVMARKAGLNGWHAELLLLLERIAVALEAR